MTPPDSYRGMIEVVCATAKKGLSHCYVDPHQRLPHHVTLSGNGTLDLHGDSLRYAAISHIGITEWLRYHPEDRAALPVVWPAISDRVSELREIGDAAVSAWAAAESNEEDTAVFADVLRSLWARQRHRCTAMELGWVILAALKCKNRATAESVEGLAAILSEAHQDLKALFCVDTGLFRRQVRGSRFSFRKRIASFADQIYPALAMAAYGPVCNDTWSIQCAASVVDALCAHQGPLGQWKWHYDSESGQVCEEYPVYSVHQDGMAPMAIFLLDEVYGSDHSKEIERGMRWLFAANELKTNLVFYDSGFVMRGVERNEPLRLTRLLRSVCCALGANGLHRVVGRMWNRLRLNRECRPYHLGWALYAWARRVSGVQSFIPTEKM